jgi:SMI1 / KNR4 family (SUKH-1)
LSQEKLVAFEQQLGTKLPDEYRQFMMESNGGRPKDGYFTRNDGSAARDAWVDYFYMIDDRLALPDPNPPTEAIAFWNYHFGSMMPTSSLMIATVCRDDRLLLMLAGQHRGEVHLVDWQVVEEVCQPTAAAVAKAMRFVAPSFGQFYYGLYNRPRHARVRL